MSWVEHFVAARAASSEGAAALDRAGAERFYESIGLITVERAAAEKKFPDQHLEQGTGPDVRPFDCADAVGVPAELDTITAHEVAHLLKATCQEGGSAGRPDTWAKVIGEEFGEYLEAADPAHVKAELVQLGAMCVRALEDILRAEAGGQG